MSSFKRKEPVVAAHPPGTRPSASARSILTISTGIPSLDDILGGGLPLGQVLVVLAPDPHTAYGDLVQRYFIAQGLACGHDVYVLDDSAADLAMGCMWTQADKTASEDVDERDDVPEDSGIKIAWRYENMKQFRTSVASPSQSLTDLYCVPLDLTCRIPGTLIDSTISSNKLRCTSVSSEQPDDACMTAMNKLEAHLRERLDSERPVLPLRISIPSLGSPQWGDVTPANILRLLHALRAVLRGKEGAEAHSSVLITLPSYMSDDGWGGPGWSQKLGWFSDGCISLRSFSSDPALMSMFPSHHGFVHIYKLPSPHTLVPASDRFSQLRGLSNFSSLSTGGGENNLAFKCTRKRLVIETLHLDAEGGVNVRRTTAPVIGERGTAGAREGPAPVSVVQVPVDERADKSDEVVKRKPKKTVAFRSDRPELYDF